MKQFLIEDVKVGISEGGIACGPIGGAVIAEMKLRSEDGTVVYHSLSEVEGTLNFYETEESTFERQVADDFDDDFVELMQQSYTAGYLDYDEFYEELNKQLPLNNSDLIHKYLAYVVRTSWDEVDRFKAATVGKQIGNFEIPVCDMEEEYLEEYEPDEE